MSSILTFIHIARFNIRNGEDNKNSDVRSDEVKSKLSFPEETEGVSDKKQLETA